MTRIHFIRHGLTEGNLRRLYYGVTDLPLAEQGRQMLTELRSAGVYPDAAGCRFFTSGLKRTEETLDLLYGPVRRQAIPGFRELDFGEFEMHSHDDLAEREDYQRYIADHTPARQAPGGERRADFHGRIVAAMEALLEELTEDAVLISHGGVIGALMGRLFPDEPLGFHDWLPEPGHGYSVSFEDKQPMSWSRF